MTRNRLHKIENKVLRNRRITPDDARFIAGIKGSEIFDLFAAANRIREEFQGRHIDLCAIINAKSGRCPEDCTYCSQSTRSSARIPVYGLVHKRDVLKKAREAKKGGAKRFCIVTSGKRVSKAELERIAEMVSAERSLGLLPCATLGLLSKDDLGVLKAAGLERYHNNLETSESFFPRVCSTHTYQEKIKTIRDAKEAGLSVCSGGIFGLGETWEDRIAMAFALREIDPDSVPINFLAPVPGTALSRRKPLSPLDALKIISLYRFVLPEKQIRVCGGRLQTLGEFNAFIFMAGASGLLVGNYLTTLGRGYAEDIDMIRQYGLTVS